MINKIHFGKRMSVLRRKAGLSHLYRKFAIKMQKTLCPRAFSAISLPGWGELAHTDCCISVRSNIPICAYPRYGVVHVDVVSHSLCKSIA